MLSWHNQDKMQFHWHKTPCNFIKWAFQHSSRWARNWQGGENNVTTKEPAVAFTKSSYCHTSVLIIKFSMCAILPANKQAGLHVMGMSNWHLLLKDLSISQIMWQYIRKNTLTKLMLYPDFTSLKSSTSSESRYLNTWNRGHPTLISCTLQARDIFLSA
jgi:hypothetical protein